MDPRRAQATTQKAVKDAARQSRARTLAWLFVYALVLVIALLEGLLYGWDFWWTGVAVLAFVGVIASIRGMARISKSVSQAEAVYNKRTGNKQR